MESTHAASAHFNVNNREMGGTFCNARYDWLGRGVEYIRRAGSPAQRADDEPSARSEVTASSQC